MQLTVNGLVAGAGYALVALGFTLIHRAVHFFHFAHGAVYAVGAYAVYLFMSIVGLHPAIAVPLALIIAAGLGAGMDFVVYRPMRFKGASGLLFLLASFGIFVLVENVLGLAFGHGMKTMRSAAIPATFRFLGASITGTQILILCSSILLLALTWLFIRATKLGKALRAVSDDPLGASVVGINPQLTISASFAIGSALAGAAGILISLETGIEPTMGFTAILKGIVAAIVGGLGSVPGAVAGGFLLGIGENVGVWKLSAVWKDAIAFGILIVFLLFRPQGILGQTLRRERL